MRPLRAERARRIALVSYRIEWAYEAEDHFREFAAREQRIIIAAVAQKLAHEPTVRTRHRKPLRPNPVAQWQLRVGDARVYYDVSEQPERVVFVRAVGVKERNRVRIGDVEVDL